jgi:hypothetical protein
MQNPGRGAACWEQLRCGQKGGENTANNLLGKGFQALGKERD